MAQKQLSFVRVNSTKQTPSVKELPIPEQPALRLRSVGPQALSTIELLACILQTSDALHQASVLLVTFGDLAGIAQASEEELAQVKRAAGSVPAARFVRETLMKAIKEENTNG